ncbi:Endogenous alpha-amylase/subtilisin inhibitor [Nymphaea thermarum]|nr:Endogenous alpha-amylase/subtilisin inhibitor [Nymphaea thermarum]
MLHNAGTMLQKTLFLIFVAGGREGLPNKSSRKPQSPRCQWTPRGSIKRSASGKAGKRPEPDTRVLRSTILAAVFSLGVLFLVSRVALGRETRPPVLDLDGRQLKSGARYHMVPLQKDRLRGFFSGSRNGTWCPMYVKQAPPAFSDGILVNFAPVGGAKTVRLSTDLNIEFYESNTCPEKPVWTLAPVDKVSGQRFVRLGGMVGNPGPATTNNWFKIEKDGDNYKLVFCPRVCETCQQEDAVCGDLGVYRDVYDRWLVLGGRPLTVKFKRFRR